MPSQHPPPSRTLTPHAVRELESPFATCSQAGVSLVSVPMSLPSAYLHQAWIRPVCWKNCCVLCTHVPLIIAIVIGVHTLQNQRGSLRGGAEAADTDTAQSPCCFHHLLPNRPWKEVGVMARARLRQLASDLVPREHPYSWLEGRTQVGGELGTAGLESHFCAFLAVRCLLI